MLKKITSFFVFLAAFTVNDQYSPIVSLPGFAVTPKKLATFSLLMLAGLTSSLGMRRMPKNGKNMAVLLFALAGIPSYGMSFLMGIGLKETVVYAVSFYSILLFYFVIAYTLDNERDLDLAIWGTVLGAAFIGLTAIAGVGVQSSGYYERSGGLGRNPNLMATYAVVALVLGLLLYLQKPRQALRRTFLLGVLAVIMLGMLASLSRTGFLCLCAVSVFLMVRTGRLDLLRWGLPAMLLIGIALVFLAPEQYFERIGTTGEEAEDLASGNLQNHRILGWWLGIKAFAASPIVGVGRASYLIWMERNDPTLGGVTPHNSYIHVLTTMGLAGFLPWVIALVLNWRDFSRVRRWGRMFRHRNDPVLTGLALRALYLQGAFVVWLTAGLVAPFADDEGLWLMLGLGTALAGQARRRALALAAEEQPAAPASGFHPIPPGRFPAPAQTS